MMNPVHELQIFGIRFLKPKNDDVKNNGDEQFHPLVFKNKNITMDKIYNIKYTDAFYINSKNIGQTKLHAYETYGYLKKCNENLIVVFIKEYKTSIKEIKNKKLKIIKGLIIPDIALLSTNNKFKNNKLKHIKIGSNVSVTWRDIVYVANLPRYDCGIMYTEGILFRTEKDHIVIKNPETIRTHPLPIENHPTKKPNYYIIPTSFIVDFEVIK